MVLYYVSGEEQQAGKHRVHKLGCDSFPIHAIYLGLCSNLEDALKKARDYYPEVDGCPDCSLPRPRRVFFNPR